MSDSFCVLPFTHFYVRPYGLKPCCYAIKPFDNFKKGTTTTEFIDINWNNAEIRKMRIQFLNGERPDICTNCWRDEAASLFSKRRWSNEMMRENGIDKRLCGSITNSDGSITRFPTNFDIRIDNKCNATCAMCEPAASSRWNRLANKYAELKEFDIVPIGNFKKNYQKNEFGFLDRLESIDYMNLSGGEPLLSFDEKFIKRHLEKVKHLRYITNLSILPAEFLDVLPKIKKLSLMISIDGVGGTYNFMRFPLDFKILLSNLIRLYETCAQFDHSDRFSFTLNFVASWFNIHDLRNSAHFLDQEIKKIKNAVKTKFRVEPCQRHPQISLSNDLGTRYRKLALSNLSKLKTTELDFEEASLRLLREALEKPKYEKKTDFFNYLDWWQNYTGIDFMKINPHFPSLLSG